jgi:hypothetical protein
MILVRVLILELVSLVVTPVTQLLCMEGVHRYAH